MPFFSETKQNGEFWTNIILYFFHYQKFPKILEESNQIIRGDRLDLSTSFPPGYFVNTRKL